VSARWAALVAAYILPGTIAAQLPSATRPAPNAVTQPSRAQELLAVGRLAAAERELYAAVQANPRQSAPRGELARYLASRGRFMIAQVLLEEALRFGADTALVARAMAEMAPYRPSADVKRVPGARPPAAIVARERARSGGLAPVLDGAEVTVPVTMSEDGRTLLRVVVRTERGTVLATIDPSLDGVAVSSATDSLVPVRTFGARGAGAPVLVGEISIGERRLAWLDGTVDPQVPVGEMRIGLDVFWHLRAIVDERTGTLTLPARTARVTVPQGSQRIPFMLGFPGVWLVEMPWRAPVAIQSPEGREMLRGTRWQLDAEAATVNVVR
jgi:hypothetical protein